MMGEAEMVALERDVEASIVPSGTRVTLEKGESVTITQSLGEIGRASCRERV